MERVAFIVDATGERIDCLLNPETLEVKRQAGVRTRASATGQLVGTGLADDPLLFTGGGRTELVLDLVFDVDLMDSAAAPGDVRAITARLWQLAENSTEERGSVRPPLVRFVWGKAWNLPGVIVSVAERFDSFGAAGEPRRSWLRLKLSRVAESAAGAARSFDAELAAAGQIAPVPAGHDSIQAIGDGGHGPDYRGVRFDLLATAALGNPQRWRMLAEHNRIANPMEVAAGTVLSIPQSGGAS
jgi:nucleoid-associated protein YgaU